MARFSLGGRKKKDSASAETPGADVGAYPAAEEVVLPPSRKPRLSLSGFKDPRRRPRFVVWTGVGVIVLASIMVLALSVTSSYWFCANVCHKVQDDAIISYNRSSHSEVSCMSCHMPVNANPIVFIIHKVEALGEIPLTVMDTYELPLNAESHVAEEMESEQCTQCHDMEVRVVSPSPGVIIDHAVHEEEGVSCTQCHNRVAHREDFELTLKNPDGKPTHAHVDFISMEGCFRCHSQEPGGRAPGDCLLCHPPDFPLKPANHNAPDFYNRFGESSGHWKLYNQRPEYCYTCHSKEFCTGCHGVEMPHPEDFAKNHKTAGESNPDVCANCHAGSAETAEGQEFCNACHHKQGDPAKPWIPQHYVVVREQGAQACFDCHDPSFCARCHVRGTPD